MAETGPAPEDAPKGLLLHWIPTLASGLLTVIAIVWVLEIPSRFDIAVFIEQMLAAVAGLGLCVAFLTLPARSGAARDRVPWYDAAAAFAGLAVMMHVALSYERLLVDVSQRTPETVAIGAIVTLLFLEGLRRAAGPALFVVVVVFTAYALFAGAIPGALQGRSIDWDNLAVYLALDTNALLGTPMKVGATIVVAFILMGQLLFASGGGAFFTDIAMALMGRRRGGAAKISVVASALFGSISGTAVSNVVSTGVITIPLMRRSGYSAVQAGAIEAVASTGGQLMPPIMGASAFLMAELLQISYVDVMIAAVLPSLLYYFAVFVQVDLLAARDRIAVLADGLPEARDVFRRGWHFLLPFAVLLYALFEMQLDPEVAALYGCAAIVVAGGLRGYGGSRLGPREIAGAACKAGRVVIELVMILGGAGFVIGVLNVTGLGFALTLFLVELGGGNLWVLLLVAAGVCIVLGMGMPTIGVYILLATLVAPAIVESGVKPLAAHMFIFYFGMMSMITPPIAMAAFAASTISRGGPWQTGWASMWLGWLAYVVPFAFIAAPALLLDGTAAQIVEATVASVAGVYFVSVAVVGFFGAKLSAAQRVVLAAAGLGSFSALMFTDEIAVLPIAAAIAAGAALLLWQAATVRRQGKPGVTRAG
jgi:TRAP transporter 4TM/12TM fusion protein